MKQELENINRFLYDEFIFSPRYRLWRHIIYWTFHINVWAVFWVIMGSPDSYERNVFNMLLWAPVFILFSYPLAYGAIPQLLLKGKVWQFFLLILAWGGVGLFINEGFHTYIYEPIQDVLSFDFISQKGQQPLIYLCMTTSAASPMIIRFFKLWTKKQKEWLNAQQEKITAELQLLKAQVHPHFLFNTLNNIYSFSLEQSPKTPEMILQLSSLLSYMLNECNTEKVKLAKEVGIMKDYLDLERERYGNSIAISWKVEGDLEDHLIAPLMMLPFLENAFKHGTSEQLERSWISVDISARHDQLDFKIRNSKNENGSYNTHGIGINNIKKRLELLYPANYKLWMKDEGHFFEVDLQLRLVPVASTCTTPVLSATFNNDIRYETTMPAYRR